MGCLAEREANRERGHTDYVRCVAKLTDTSFVSGSSDRTLILWNTEDGSVIRTFQGHTSDVRCVAKLTDTTFVSGSGDKTLKLWNTEERLFWFYLLRDRLPLPEHLVFELTQYLKENEFIMTYK